jgi:hypothetical protein
VDLEPSRAEISRGLCAELVCADATFEAKSTVACGFCYANHSMREIVLAIAAVLAVGACKTHEDAPAAASTPVKAAASTPDKTAAGSPGKLRVVDAPAEGDVDAVVRGALAQATEEKRTLVVYVGAKWCEPCQRFHHAAERGELDSTFPDVDMLGFDLDRDNERLAAAGYVSKLIPLFALPAPDGRASGKQVEGGIKGDGAVGFIAPRLKKMLQE